MMSMRSAVSQTGTGQVVTELFISKNIFVKFHRGSCLWYGLRQEEVIWCIQQCTRMEMQFGSYDDCLRRTFGTA